MEGVVGLLLIFSDFSDSFIGFFIKRPGTPNFPLDMTADVVPRMEAASPALNLPSAAKLRPSPAISGSMEGAIKMWLQVGNVQKLQQVNTKIQYVQE